MNRGHISDAVTEVRRISDGGCSPLDLVFGRDPGRSIELSADMVVPPIVADDFGESAKPSTTLLTYTVRLRYAPESDRLLVQYESLAHAKLKDSKSFIGFDSSREFRKSVALGGRWGGPLISTKEDRIQLHGDGGSRGRTVPVGRSPLTVVGGTNTADYPTVLAAKREMSSWRVLHPVVPVRMSESWLLFDGPAIAKAAGSPMSQVPVPCIAQIENIPDPKDRLDELLFQAAGAPTGRHGRRFVRDIAKRRVSVAEYISDYSPLENAPAFRSFQAALAERYPYKNQLGK